MRRKNGFTLIEMVETLLLLALLMAILLPSLSGYIRRARERCVIARANVALLAAQAILAERREPKDWTAQVTPVSLLRRGPGRAPTAVTAEELLELTELSPTGVVDILLGWDEEAAVTQFIWMEAEHGGMCSAVWDGINWSVRHESAPE